MNAVEVERVSKRYFLGEERPGGTLREAVSQSVRRLARRHSRVPREEVWALCDVDLTLAAGETVGIIGRNGAGKSTLLKILSRITEPTSGVARTRGRVASLLEVGTGFHPELTGRENVYLNGAILGMKRTTITERFDEIISFAGVERFVDTPVKRYSAGMYLRLAFSVAAHLEPDIMVVDEVLAVGDAAFQTKCLQRLETVEREGRTVLFVSHNLWAITRLCPRAIWLEGGRIHADGPASEIVDAYLVNQTSRPADRTVRSGNSNAVVALASVTVLNASGGPTDLLRRDQPVTLEVRFSLHTAVPGLDLAAWLINSHGVEVLSEAWSDTVQERDCHAGSYVARLSVPPVLNVSDYVVGMWIGTSYETLLMEFTAARFRLEGDVMERPKRAVVLDLPWQVRRVDSERSPGPAPHTT
jgi:ABC-2 type transport system ATP-binding protein/lipopolysaccharide transport system ATP-binding protein